MKINITTKEEVLNYFLIIMLTGGVGGFTGSNPRIYCMLFVAWHLLTEQSFFFPAWVSENIDRPRRVCWKQLSAPRYYPTHTNRSHPPSGEHADRLPPSQAASLTCVASPWVCETSVGWITFISRYFYVQQSHSHAVCCYPACITHLVQVLIPGMMMMYRTARLVLTARKQDLATPLLGFLYWLPILSGI